MRLSLANLLTILGLLALATPCPAQDAPLHKAKYPAINVHRHCALADDAAIKAEFGVLDRVGVDKVVILDGDSPRGTLPKWLELQRKYPERLIIFKKIQFEDAKTPTFFTDLVRDLERDAKAGIRGVKVWKDLGMYRKDANGRLLAADDERLAPFYAKCGELGLPVLIHTADPREYWYPLTYNSLHFGLRQENDQHYHNPEMPRWEDLIRQRDNLLKRHPRTTFIGAHMGSLCMDLEKLGQTLDAYPNFFVDCAARQRILGRLNPPAVRAFFTKYQDRILFGTDDLALFKERKPTPGNMITYPSDDPAWISIDPTDAAAVAKWQDRAASVYSEYFRYFETDQLDITDPNRSGGGWLRLAGAALPDEVLEKLYRTNAERVILGRK